MIRRARPAGLRDRILFAAVGLVAIFAIVPDIAHRKWWAVALDGLFLVNSILGLLLTGYSDVERRLGRG